MKQVALLSLALILMKVSLVPAQDASTSDKTTSITYLEQAPVIDGVLDDPIWSQAVVVDDLHQVAPKEYAEPSQRTEFLLAYDQNNLYVGARVFEEDPSLIGAKILRQGEGLNVDDRIRIVLDPYNNKRSGYQFQMNANSVRYDGIFLGEQSDWNWDGIWRGASKIADYGWSTEVAIPFKTLSFKKDTDWGINLVREIVRDNERVAWSSRNRSINPAVAGTLKGIRGVSQGMGLDIVPSLSIQNLNNRVVDENETKTEPSLDIYYKLTSSLNGSLTFNTDFSATEVDNRQVDLSRFSQFFPEKRSFFLRESDIFEFGGIGSDNTNRAVSGADRQNARPFFSRRIGLSESGEPVGLDGGARITGRVGNWNVGALGIRQEEFEGVDATNIFVGRLTANVLNESAAGVILTLGDPRSNVDNQLFGVDFSYRNTRLADGKRLEANIWYQQSDTEGVNGDDAAFGLRASYPSEEGWRATASVLEVQKNFNPALGFVRRAGIRQYTSNVIYIYRHRGGYIESLISGVNLQRVNLIDGDLQSQSLVLRLLKVTNHKGDQVELQHNPQKESLLGDFEIADGIVIPAGEYSFADTNLSIGTASSRAVSFDLGIRAGDFFAGTLKSFEFGADWRPSKHFTGSFSYEVDFVDLPQGRFDRRLISTNLAVIFSNALSWVNLIQFDNVSNNLGMDSRLHWTPQAGRDVYLVLGQGFNKDEISNRFTSTQTNLTFKVDYTLRF